MPETDIVAQPPQVPPDGFEVLPVRGIGDVRPGDDLASLIATAAPWLRDGDVLVVTSKIVSKAEGQLTEVPIAGPDREIAREEILTAETARPVARRGNTRIVQTHHGFVMASAGIDASNVDRSRLVLLPKDPDASARDLRATLRERLGVDVAIVISDTMGRPWRNGLTDVALGAAGIGALRDYRGELDPYGNPLQITQMAIVDELAGAGELVKGKCDQVPVAVVRGYLSTVEAEDGAGVTELVRDAEHDLFSLGTAEARAAGLRDAALLADALPVVEPAALDVTVVNRAIASVSNVVAPSTRFVFAASVPDCPAGAILCYLDGSQEPASLIQFGADMHRLRAALAAEAVASAPLPPPPNHAALAMLSLGLRRSA